MAFSDLIRNTMDAFLSKKYMADGLKKVEDDVDKANSKAESAVSTANNANDRVEDIIASNGSAESTEVIAGRHDNINNVTYDNLGKRLDAHSASLADNTQQISNNTTAIQSLGSGSPAGIFSTLALLQSDTNANTTDGKKKIYLVTTDGNWYYWNSTAWTAGGVYQGTNWQEGITARDGETDLNTRLNKIENGDRLENSSITLEKLSLDINTVLNFDSNGDLNSVSETDQQGTTRTTTLNKNADGTINSVIETGGGRTVTSTFNYTNGKLTSISSDIS